MISRLRSILAFNTVKSVKNCHSCFQKRTIVSRCDSKSKTIKLLRQQEAIEIDQALFNEYGFGVDQLMELAGLSCAAAISKTYKDDVFKSKKVLIICGPGNNGGDGLVCSRHLKMFGYEPILYYPKHGKGILFENLIKQCHRMDIEFIAELKDIQWNSVSIVVDALFGFSYRAPCRPEYLPILQSMASLNPTTHKLVSIDIPSGWDVENGPNRQTTPELSPDCLISLTAPKECAKHFTGEHHWVGGRFIPKSLMQKFSLTLPIYPGEEQCVKVPKSA